MVCTYVYKSGKNKGKECGVRPRNGSERCSKHTLKRTTTIQTQPVPQVTQHIKEQGKSNIENIIVNNPENSPEQSRNIKDEKQVLFSLFNELNKEYLGSDYTLVWDQAKKRYGKCSYGKKEISLSEYCLTRTSLEELKNTVRHEIAHACVNKYNNGRVAPHGKEWKNWAVKVGAEPKACGSKIEHDSSVIKWVLRHMDTGEIYKRYIRKPKRTGRLRPTMYMPKDKNGTMGKLEIVPFCASN